MIVVRATVKLLSKLNVDPVDVEMPSSGRLGDWYCNIMNINNQQLLLCTSEKTLLPIVVQAKEISTFPVRLTRKLEVVLRSAGIPEEKIKQELEEMKQVVFTKTASRKVLGSMNDFKKLLEAVFVPGTTLEEAVRFLGETPCGPLGMSTPIETTKRIFEVDLPSRVKRFHLRLVTSND